MWSQKDTELAALAARQHEVFTRRQARDAGFAASTVTRRVVRGEWTALGRRTLCRAGTRLDWKGRLAAAVLDHTLAAAASHRSAAALHGLPGFPTGPVVVSVLRRGHHRHGRARLHETSWLPDEHLTEVDGIRCTTLARTIFDLAAIERAARVGRALDNATNQFGLRRGAVQAVLEDLGRRGRPGTALIRELLEARGEGYVATESELEDRLVRVLLEHGVEQPQRQVHAGGGLPAGRVDFAYSGRGLVIEADGRKYHTSLLDRSADRERDNRLAAGGWRVIRVTWADLVERPAAVAATIRTALNVGA